MSDAMMTDTSTEAVMALIEGVTAGPWADVLLDTDLFYEVKAGHSLFSDGYFGYAVTHIGDGPAVCLTPMCHADNTSDARFIAAARELVPALLVERDRLATAHAQMQQTFGRLATLQAALEACVFFADGIADAAGIDMEETCLQVRVMPEGREVATKSWAKVQGEARAALAASQKPDPVTNADNQQQENTNGQ